MTTTRKIMLLAFATMLVLNLQLTTPLTQGMENGFTVEQLADNIFIPEAFATNYYECHDWGCYGGQIMCAYLPGGGGHGVWCFTEHRW